MSAVLRVSGPDFDLDRSLPSIPAHKLDRVWRAGEMGHLGKVSTTSGFSVLLSASEDGQHVVTEAVSAFLELAPQVEKLVCDGASVEIDFALLVGAMTSRSLTFEPQMLQVIVQYGVRILVSAYPVLEDDCDEET